MKTKRAIVLELNSLTEEQQVVLGHLTPIQVLQETPVRGKYFLADALYSMSIKLLKMILEMGFVPVIRTSKSTHNQHQKSSAILCAKK